MKNIFTLLFWVASVVNGASITDTVNQTILDINECISVFERVNQRYGGDSEAYEAGLSKGYKNLTLEAEQHRDETYLNSTSHMIKELRFLRGILIQQQTGEDIKQSLESANELLELHEMVLDNILMKDS